MNKQELGKFGEDIATNYLKIEGYEIIERNFTCRLGEVDIIAKKGRKIVFIEVKTRTSDQFGMPREAVDTTKKDHIRKVAAVYMMWQKSNNFDVAFDVMEVYCNHIEDAF